VWLLNFNLDTIPGQAIIWDFQNQIMALQMMVSGHCGDKAYPVSIETSTGYPPQKKRGIDEYIVNVFTGCSFY